MVVVLLPVVLLVVGMVVLVSNEDNMSKLRVGMVVLVSNEDNMSKLKTKRIWYTTLAANEHKLDDLEQLGEGNSAAEDGSRWIARFPACLGNRLLSCVCMREDLKQRGEDHSAAADGLIWMARAPAGAGGDGGAGGGCVNRSCVEIVAREDLRRSHFFALS